MAEKRLASDITVQCPECLAAPGLLCVEPNKLTHFLRRVKGLIFLNRPEIVPLIKDWSDYDYIIEYCRKFK